MKPSFILHKDSLCVLEELTDEQRGKLFYAIYCYQIGKDVELDMLTKIAFSQFKNQFIRDDEKFKSTVESRKQAGSKGGKQTQAKQANASSSKQTKANQAVKEKDSVNESVSVNDNESKTLVKTKSYDDSLRLSNYLLNNILKANPSFKKPNLDSWAKDIDKAIRIDGRNVNQLKECIDWIYSDSGQFWQKNILSGKKLREKFDTMNMQVIARVPTKQEKQMNSLDLLKAKAMKKDGYSDEEILQEMSK